MIQVGLIYYTTDEVRDEAVSYFPRWRKIDYLTYRDAMVQNVVAAERVKDPVLDKWLRSNPILQLNGRLKPDILDVELPGWGVCLGDIVEQVETHESFCAQASEYVLETLKANARRGSDTLVLIPMNREHIVNFKPNFISYLSSRDKVFCRLREDMR